MRIHRRQDKDNPMSTTDPGCTQPPLLSTRHFLELGADILSLGHGVRFRAGGRSMHPTIKEGEAITVEPVSPSDVKRGDILLYRQNSGVVAHRVVAIERKKPDDAPIYIIRGDASTARDGPVEPQQILGKVVSVERDGRCIDPYCVRSKIFHMVRLSASHIKRRLRNSHIKMGQHGWGTWRTHTGSAASIRSSPQKCE